VEEETLNEFLKLYLKTQIYFNTYYFIVVKWVYRGETSGKARMKKQGSAGIRGEMQCRKSCGYCLAISSK
jgi:hypothetical protein